MASSQSFSMIQRRMLLSPPPASPVKRELPLWTSATRLPRAGAALHLAQQVGEEEHLAVAGAGDEAVLGVAAVVDDEAGVEHLLLAAHPVEVDLPGLAVWGIGEHEVELLAWEGVAGEGRAERDVVGLLPLALEDEVRLADCVGLRVHVLAVEVDRHVLAALGGEPGQGILRDGQHAARAACAVVDEVGSRLDPVGGGLEDEVGHELHDVAWGEVLASLLVVLLVEAADELLEYRAHGVVVEPLQADRFVGVQDVPGTEVYGPIQEFLDQVAERRPASIRV